MNVWMNKKTGDLAIARRVWLEVDTGTDDISPPGYSIQVNVSEDCWAFQNKYGVVFVLPKRAQKEFEDLGQL